MLTFLWLPAVGLGSLWLLVAAALGAALGFDFRQRDRFRQAARRSAERLQVALDAADAGVWEWDLRTGRNTWSQELWSLYGLRPGSCQPSYEAWRQIIHPDDRAEAERLVGEAARSASELNVEFRVAEGKRWLLARARPFRNEKGQAESFIGIALDITRRKQMEESLREREQNLRLFTEAAPVAIAMYDRRMRYLAASRRFREDYGLRDRELVGLSHYEVFPEIPESWRAVHKRCLAGATERHPGESFVRADGSEQWIRWEIQPWFQNDGEIGGIVLFSEDITAEKSSERALQESHTQFRTLANAIPQLCWMARADGFIYWYNDRWYDYTGTTRDEMTESGWQSVHHPEALSEVLRRWKDSIASGEPFDMVFPLRNAHGAFHPFLTRVMPVRDRQGAVAQWFGTSTDISEQLEKERALRDASEQLRTAIDAAGLGCWDYRFETGKVQWDDRSRQMFGLPSRISSDNEAFERIHPDDRENTTEALKHAIAGVNGGAYHQTLRVIWPDGSVHWISSHGRVYQESGQTRFTGVNKDITGRKQDELEILRLNSDLEQRVSQRTAELVAANQELEAFTYSVSHDLRAPLRGIDGWSLALADDYASVLDDRAQKYLARVRGETQRMGTLIDDMLKLSRASSTPLRVATIDLTRIARSIAAGLMEENAHRRIRIDIQPGLTMSGDDRLMEIALTNLIGNAVKFTGPRPVAIIEFGQECHNNQRVFCIKDNGVGFDMNYSGTLFGAFQRLHKTSEFPGTGIGLAIVQRVVQRHKGRVWAEAQRDRGASFYFTIGTVA